MAVQTARVRSGQRRIQVRVQNGTAVLDPLRGQITGWTTYMTDWANVVPVPVVVSELQATKTFVVQMRYRRDLERNFQEGIQQRVVTPTYTLKVLEVVNVNLRDRDMDVHCAEAQPGT